MQHRDQPTCDELSELISCLGVLSSAFGRARVPCRLQFARSRQPRHPPRTGHPASGCTYVRLHEVMTIKKSRAASPPGTGSDPMRPSRREHDDPSSSAVMGDATRRELLYLAALGALAFGAKPANAAPEGRITIGAHVSLAPVWFDPAETSSIITPFMLMYAMHDAMAKAMPGNPMAPCLAESWTMAADGLSYTFVLRPGARFHNGEPVTAEDVKFSFERYRGASHQLMKDRVATVETPDGLRVHFRLKAPWPDFLTFYTGASGAGWVVPKKYVEQVGETGFKKFPIGAGPYKFVSFTPGLELACEAFEGYWRKLPAIKRLVFKVIPDE